MSSWGTHFLLLVLKLILLHCMKRALFSLCGTSETEARIVFHLTHRCFVSSAALLSDTSPFPADTGQDHRITEWPGLKRTTVIIEFQPPCYVPGHQPPDQAAQSHIQPGLERLQGWGTHSLLGQPVQCVTTLWVKNFLLISNLSLPCLGLKPFSL